MSYLWLLKSSACNKKCFIFPPHLTSASALPGETKNPKLLTDDNFLSYSKTVQRCILHSTWSNGCCAKLSTFFHNITVQGSTPITARFRELYSRVWVV